MIGPEDSLVLVSRREPSTPSTRALRRSGTTRHVAGVVLVFRDVTERRRTQEALEEANRNKDEFLALLAHELRNPLAPIRNSLQVMRLAGDNSEVLTRVRGIMERQLGHMVRLVDDLLDVSRITRGKVELRWARLDVSQVIETALETSRPVIEASAHRLVVKLPPEGLRLDGDLTRLAQVVSNLLNNAAKYTPAGGNIELTVERQGREGVITVRDDGIGIPPDMLSQVFDMFTQVDRNRDRAQGGLGIGLTLVRKLVEMHGGIALARSEGEGKGSEFVIRLPLATDDLGMDGRDGDARISGTVNPPRRRILVVDDNQDSASSLAMLLRIMGNEVRMAADGMAALELAPAFRPDVVLLDIGMPGMSGHEVARRMRLMPELKDAMFDRPDRLGPGRRPAAIRRVGLRGPPGQAHRPGRAGRVAAETTREAGRRGTRSPTSLKRERRIARSSNAPSLATSGLWIALDAAGHGGSLLLDNRVTACDVEFAFDKFSTCPTSTRPAASCTDRRSRPAATVQHPPPDRRPGSCVRIDGGFSMNRKTEVAVLALGAALLACAPARGRHAADRQHQPGGRPARGGERGHDRRGEPRGQSPSRRAGRVPGGAGGSQAEQRRRLDGQAHRRIPRWRSGSTRSGSRPTTGSRTPSCSPSASSPRSPRRKTTAPSRPPRPCPRSRWSSRARPRAMMSITSSSRARKGQVIVVDAQCARIGSGVDPTIRLTTAGSSRRFVASADDSPGLLTDARLVAELPEDTDYVVEISDSRYQGGGRPVYRLVIGPVPMAEEIYPAGRPRGRDRGAGAARGDAGRDEDRRVDHRPGRRLARSIFPRISSRDARLSAWPPGRCSTSSRCIPWPSPRCPSSASRPIPRPDPSGRRPPWSSTAGSTRPATRIASSLAVTAGQRLHVAVEAYEDGSALDGVLQVQGANGAVIANADDTPIPRYRRQPAGMAGTELVSPDPSLDLTVPGGTTEITLVLRDLEGRGGVGFPYRIVVTPIVPTFEPEPERAPGEHPQGRDRRGPR